MSSVVIFQDGTWVLYFHTVNRLEKSVIGLATAPGPLGPWTVKPDPVLTGGESGTWDGGNLSWPHVVQTEEGFFMYYQAENRLKSKSGIGMAFSQDGLSWVKFDDPETSDAEFASSDPVLTAEGGWDRGKIGRPVPVYSPAEGWVMIYAGGDLNFRGLATSDDEIAWQAYPGNPVIDETDFPLPGSTWDTALVFNDGSYFYFMEIGSLQGTDIYLLVHEGQLP